VGAEMGGNRPAGNDAERRRCPGAAQPFKRVAYSKCLPLSHSK
jgi:hypothetical protein